MLDGLFPRPFTFVPPKLQLSLDDFLEQNRSSIINWALYVPKKVLKTKICVGDLFKLALEESTFFDFLVYTLIED